jgi:hypothetical protein
MPRGGRQPGAGRPKGAKGKATIERELEAARRVAANASGERRDSALQVLERIMVVAEGAAGLLRPTPEKEIAKGAQKNPDGDWDRFKAWCELTAKCSMELAKYQAAQIKSVDAPTPPPEPGEIDQRSRKRFGLRVFEGGKPLTDVA